MNTLGKLGLVLSMSTLLVSAQALWGSAVKNDNLISNGLSTTVTNFVSSPKVWIGAFLYMTATIVYFLLLSNFKFFSVQIGMAGLGIFFSTSLAVILFHEQLNIINILGMLMVMGGVVMVFSK